MAMREWPRLVTGNLSDSSLMDEAQRLVERYKPTAVVGHSLGASVARTVAHAHGLYYRGYGRPGLFSIPGDRANRLDPVAYMLQKNGPGLFHSLWSYRPVSS